MRGNLSMWKVHSISLPAIQHQLTQVTERRGSLQYPVMASGAALFSDVDETRILHETGHIRQCLQLHSRTTNHIPVPKGHTWLPRTHSPIRNYHSFGAYFHLHFSAKDQKKTLLLLNGENKRKVWNTESYISILLSQPQHMISTGNKGRHRFQAPGNPS